MPTLELFAPLPPQGCAQNFRGHWVHRSEATRSYRAQLRGLTLEALGRKRPKPASVTLSCEFVIARKRDTSGWAKHLRNYKPQDVTNAVGAFKAGEDGIADALGIDDRAAIWYHGPMRITQAGPGDSQGVRVLIEYGLSGPQHGTGEGDYEWSRDA